MFKTTQTNHKIFFGIVLLSFLANSGAAKVADCDGSAASTAFTLAHPGAPATACGAACSASVIAINAAKAANVTACNKAVADAKTACSASNDTCVNAEFARKHACSAMLLYVKASTDDSNRQTEAACKAAIKGNTGCDAAYSESYISCNVAHKKYYSSCNEELNEYLQVCVAKGKSVSDCRAAFEKARKSCQSSAKTAHNSCVASAKKAQLSC